MSDTRYFAIDPGGVTGWAEFINDKPVAIGELPKSEVMPWLLGIFNGEWYAPPDAMIVENYRIRPVPLTRGHANTWNECWQARVIGMVQILCYDHDIEFVTQEPHILEVGYGYAGLPYNKNKKGTGTHMQDAVAHGTYWWFSNQLKRRGERGVAKEQS